MACFLISEVVWGAGVQRHNGSGTTAMVLRVRIVWQDSSGMMTSVWEFALAVVREGEPEQKDNIWSSGVRVYWVYW